MSIGDKFAIIVANQSSCIRYKLIMEYKITIVLLTAHINNFAHIKLKCENNML